MRGSRIAYWINRVTDLMPFPSTIRRMKTIARPEFLLVLLAHLASGLLMSQARREVSQPTPQAEQQHLFQPQASPASSDEKAFLRGQLAEMHDQDQRLLATVYWSLSAVFLVVVVIAGLNWFANYRVYERERESLRQEVNAQARILQSDSEERFRKLSQSLVAGAQKQSTELTHQLNAELKKSVAAEIKNYRDELRWLHEQLSVARFEDTAFRAKYYESHSTLLGRYDAFVLWVEISNI